MADNVNFPLTGSGDSTAYAATKQASYSGQNAHFQLVELVHLSGSEGAYTVNTISSADGLLVNLGANNDVTISGTVTVDGSAVTQPISAASLPLPAGASTAANQTTGNASLATIAGAVSGTEMQVDVLSSALPAGAATAANQATGNSSLATLAGAVAGTEMQVDIVSAPTITVDSELPAAAALADNAANPTVPSVGTFPLWYDGVTWDRARGDSANGLLVNLGTNNDVTVSGTVTVDGSGVTQPISAASLPLPTGAATSANQATGNASLATIAGAVAGTEMQVDVLTLPNVTIGAALPAGTNQIGDVVVNNVEDGAGTTVMDAVNNAMRVNVVAGSTSGTEYTEDAVAPANGSAPAVALIRADTPAGIASTDGDILLQRATNFGAAFVQVLDSSGNFINTFGGSGGTAATDDTAFTAGAGQGTPMMGFASTDVVDAGDVGVVGMTTGRFLKVSIENDAVGIGGGTQYQVDTAAGATDTGTASLFIRDDALTTLTPVDGDYVSGRTNSVGALWVAGNGTFTVDGSGATQPISASSLPLPTGAATSANQTTIIGHVDGIETLLGTIDADTSTLAGAVAGTEMQVDIVSAPTLTVDSELPAAAALADNAANPTAPAVGAFGMLWDGVTWDRAPGTSADGALVNLGTNNDVTVSGTVTVDGSGVTQPISAASLPLPTGAATSANQTTGNSSLATIAGAVSGTEMQVDIVTAPTITVDSELPTAAALSDAAANPTAPAVGSFGMIWNGVTWDRAPGAAASGLLVNLGTNNDVTITGTVTVDGSATTQPISAASLPLPTGAATAANQSTGNTSLATIAGAVSGTEMQVDVLTLPALPAGTNNIGDVDIVSLPNEGQQTMANSISVAISSDQSAVAVTPAGNVAHDAVDSGNPVKIGAVAYETDGTAPGTSVAELDRSNLKSTRDGRLLVSDAHPFLWYATGNYSTAQTDATVKAAPGAGLSLYVTDVVISTAAAMNIFLEHGTTYVIPPMYFAANGGLSTNFKTPLRIPANTALTITSSATGNHSVLVSGYTAP